MSLSFSIFVLFPCYVIHSCSFTAVTHSEQEEQACFSIIEHFQTIQAVFEKTKDYNIPSHLVLFDYHKAFDSVETCDLHDNRIDSWNYASIRNVYFERKYRRRTNDRQGDIISLGLYTLVLKNVFRELVWDEKGHKIDGKYLNHSRFADDIVLISTDIHEL